MTSVPSVGSGVPHSGSHSCPLSSPEPGANILRFPEPSRTPPTRSAVIRMAGLLAGLGTQAYFLLTVVWLFEFLRYGAPRTGDHWMLVDTVLALQFVVPHSLLLHPRTRRTLKPWITSEFYGLFYCVATCLSLFIVFEYWQSSPVILWDARGWGRTFVLSGFYGSWLMLFFSLHISGAGYQTGWTQWLSWWKEQPLKPRPFVEHSLYRWFRHPIYLSFLGLIWFVPTMSFDHALLTGIWTVYIFVGSWLKDERLQFYLGDTYKDYRSRVPGYPVPRLTRITTESSRAAA